MTKNKKYDCQIVPENGSWTANITRRITAKKSQISKTQTGFPSEAEAREWANQELEVFLTKLNQRNKRRSKAADKD